MMIKTFLPNQLAYPLDCIAYLLIDRQISAALIPPITHDRQMFGGDVHQHTHKTLRLRPWFPLAERFIAVYICDYFLHRFIRRPVQWQTGRLLSGPLPSRWDRRNEKIISYLLAVKPCAWPAFMTVTNEEVMRGILLNVSTTK